MQSGSANRFPHAPLLSLPLSLSLSLSLSLPPLRYIIPVVGTRARSATRSATVTAASAPNDIGRREKEGDAIVRSFARFVSHFEKEPRGVAGLSHVR